jgi:thiamine biosynthesis lipoprotein
MLTALAKTKGSRILSPPRLPEGPLGDLNASQGTWERIEGRAFGTHWRVDCVRTGGGRGLRALERRIGEVLEAIDAQMSLWRADSDVVRFNRSRVGTRFLPREPMQQVVSHAVGISRLTEGAFDPTMAEAVDLWGFGARAVEDTLPSASAILAIAQGRSGTPDSIQDGGCLVRHPGRTLDLCGIAKGYAVDAVMDIVRASLGARAALVEIGGELKGWGLKPDGMPWWVSVEGAVEPTLAALCGWAVATSGDYVRSFRQYGIDYCHTLDPKTLAPIRNDVASVTVFDPECWRADALATALMVMGAPRAMAFAGQHDIPCLLTKRTGLAITEAVSPALRSWMQTDD